MHLEKCPSSSTGLFFIRVFLFSSSTHISSNEWAGGELQLLPSRNECLEY